MVWSLISGRADVERDTREGNCRYCRVVRSNRTIPFPQNLDRSLRKPRRSPRPGFLFRGSPSSDDGVCSHYGAANGCRPLHGLSGTGSWAIRIVKLHRARCDRYPARIMTTVIPAAFRATATEPSWSPFGGSGRWRIAPKLSNSSRRICLTM
jgi:hypothetical protein